jgi:periplasmic copper chaperone A
LAEIEHPAHHSTDSRSTERVAQSGVSAKVTVGQPWTRASGAKTGAAYMTLANQTDTDDGLTGVSSDVAAKAQIYQIKVVNGVMQIREVAGGLAIPAGGSVTLKPGSYNCRSG